MRALFFAPLLAASPAVASPALAEPVQYHCTGASEGAGGERADVTIYFGAQGQREGQSATWDPPRVPDPAGAADPPDLALTLIYPNPGPESPGGADLASLTAMAFAPPGSRSAGKVERRLDGLRAEIRIDGGAAIISPLERDPRIGDLPMTAMRSASLTLPPRGTGRIAVRLLDRRGRAVAGAHFDLTDTARHDALYHQAWVAAEGVAREPTKCPVAGE